MLKKPIFLTLSSLISQTLRAQTNPWPSPSKLISLINPLPLGGAGGTVVAPATAKMPTDGYTRLLGAVHHLIAPLN